MLDIFVSSWVSIIGLPAYLTTDRGAQLTSGMWTTWCNEMQVDHITTTAFHPQASGMVEQLHHQLKEALCAKGATSACADHLPRIILGLRAASKDESEVSATCPTCTPGSHPTNQVDLCRGGGSSFPSGFCKVGV